MRHEQRAALDRAPWHDRRRLPLVCRNPLRRSRRSVLRIRGTVWCRDLGRECRLSVAGRHRMMRPLVDSLAQRSLPLIADDPDELYVLLPIRRSLSLLDHHLGMSDPKAGPSVLAEGDDGSSLVGYPQPRAGDLYDAGTPPVHGLAANPAPSPRIARIVLGDKLLVACDGKKWVVSDEEGRLGSSAGTPGWTARSMLSRANQSGSPPKASFTSGSCTSTRRATSLILPGFVEPIHP
jgi:hypothetical protein